MRFRAALWAAVAALSIAGTASAADASLEDEKLRQEIRKLELENAQAASWSRDVLAWAPFATVLIAGGGLVWPILRELRERRAQRERELEQRRAETRRRFDEQFAQAIANLGAEKDVVRVSGAASLAALARDEYAEANEEIYAVIRANLALEEATEDVRRLLARGFGRAFRIHLAHARESGDDPDINLARCHLARVDLSDLDLREADIAFAELRGANLTGSTLYRARGIEVGLEKARLSRANLEEARLHKAHAAGAQFHDARLVSAELREAELTSAEFYRAAMQGAHLDGATLRGARFEQANLAETFFRGAAFDDAALRSILNAQNWEKAVFDPDVRERLERLAERRARGRSGTAAAQT